MQLHLSSRGGFLQLHVVAGFWAFMYIAGYGIRSGVFGLHECHTIKYLLITGKIGLKIGFRGGLVVG